MNLFERATGFARRKAAGALRRARNVLRVARRAVARADLADNVAALRSDLAVLHEDLRRVRSEVAGQISFLSHDLARQLESSAAQSSQQLSELQATAFDAKNRLIHLDTSLHTRFNDVLNVQFPTVLEQLHQVSAFQLRIGRRSSVSGGQQRATRPAITNQQPFDAALARAQRDFPSVFTDWKERLDATSEALAVTETGNVANSADVYSHLFRAFVEHHAEGSILDVGCGPAGKPFYLASYPSHLIAGIDPLLGEEHGDIEAVKGISEYLPWPDRSFSTVISATSLDHCISLERSMDEMIRVLRPDGKLLLWLGSNPGASPYRPLDPDFVPADRFHLFHFDVAWFEPLLEQRFAIVDRVKLDRAGYSHVFYCLRQRASTGDVTQRTHV